MKRTITIIVAISLCMNIIIFPFVKAYSEEGSNALSDGLSIESFLVRFTYLSTSLYGVAIDEDPFLIKSDEDGSIYSLGEALITSNQNGKVKSVLVAMGEEATKEQIMTILCIIDCLEYDWNDHLAYSNSTITENVSSILKKAMSDLTSKGEIYTYTYAKLTTTMFGANINE